MKFSSFLFAILFILSLQLKTFAQCGPCRKQVELITNGNFSNGNNGFSSDLNYATGFFCPLCPENTYTVGANATFYHNDFTGSDHTNPPFGSFFIANGSANDGAQIWCQSLPVQSNIDYTFSFWARDVTNNSNPHPLALLEPIFNGVPAGDTLEADGGWQQFNFTWNSGSNTTLDLCIINHQTNSGGNDFGLDDISLSACENIYLSQTANAGPDASLCSLESLQIGQMTIPGYSYHWDNATGLNSTIISSPVFSLENQTESSLTQTYILSTDSANVGCVTTDTIQIQVLPMPTFELGDDVDICPGTFATLQAGNQWESVTWSDGQQGDIIQTGPASLTATVTFGICVTTDDITVSEIPMPEVFLGNDTTICEGDVLILHAGVMGTWNDDVQSDTLEVSQADIYSFEYINGPCSVDDEIMVAVTPLPNIVITADSSFCEGTTLLITANAVGLWNTGEVANAITVDDEGYYDIVVINQNCSKSAGIDVKQEPLPVIPDFEYFSICEDDSLILDATHEYNSYYNWSNGDTTSYASLQGKGFYKMNIGNHCDTTEVEFYIDTYPCTWAIFIPTAFTPNDDEINEGWFVSGYNVTEVRVHVYNRFGDLIFFADELGEKWNPSLGIGDDVYSYYVTAKTFDGDDFEEKGRLYLLR